MVDTSPILGYDFLTVDMIVKFADTHDLPPTMLLASGLQESNLNIYENTGDGGVSFGCFQIYTPKHGGDYSTWTGYDGLARSMVYMGENKTAWNGQDSRWHWAFLQVGGWNRWVRDSARVMYELGPKMQGSIDWTWEETYTNISRAYAIYGLYQNRLIAAGGTAEPPAPPPTRERELLDAVTVSRDTWQEQVDALATLLKAAQIRHDNDEALVSSFGG